MNSMEPGRVTMDMERYLDRLRAEYPHLYRCIDLERAATSAREFERGNHSRDDFGQEDGGRGTSYVHAQALNVRARERGIDTMLGFLGSGTTNADANGTGRTIVDVLGGDGLVRRVAGELGRTDVNLLTCDASPYMVRASWAAGHPALLQRADRLLQRDASVDGVLVAYGSHHIDPTDRADVALEAYRVLKPGGVFVLHDFAVGSPMEEWFTEVVDRYSLTGHQFEHFTREEISGYLAKAGFEAFEVVDVADPYVARAASPRRAALDLGRYLLNMYGLEKVSRVWGPAADRWVINQAKKIFRYVQPSGGVDGYSLDYDPSTSTWCATVPRVAIVGIARKLTT
jgi:SAM-dependent methyltransferase